MRNINRELNSFIERERERERKREGERELEKVVQISNMKF